MFPSRRLGKWGKDEEAYAARLIQEFEWGCVKDCANGTTLRLFLATKLFCAPMRISKKYAGKAIGKHVFMRSYENKSRARSLVPSTKQLRFDFLKACYKKMDIDMPKEVAEQNDPSKIDEEEEEEEVVEVEEQPIKQQKTSLPLSQMPPHPPSHGLLPQKPDQPECNNITYYGYDLVPIVDSTAEHYAPYGLDNNRVPYASTADSLNELYTNFKRARDNIANGHASIHSAPTPAHARAPTHASNYAYFAPRPAPPPAQPNHLEVPALSNHQARPRRSPVLPTAPDPGATSDPDYQQDFQQWLRSQPTQTMAQYYNPPSSGITRITEQLAHPSRSPPLLVNMNSSGMISGTILAQPDAPPANPSPPTVKENVTSAKANNTTLKKVTQTLINYSAIASTVNSYQFGYGDPESTSQPPSQVTANTLKIHQKYQNKSIPTNYTHPALKPIGSKFAGDSNSDENVNSDKADNSDDASPPLATTAVSSTATLVTDHMSSHAELKAIPNSASGEAVRNSGSLARLSSTTKINNNKSHISTSNDSSADDSDDDSPSPTTAEADIPRKKSSSKSTIISDGSEQSNSCTDSNSDNNSDQGSSDRTNSSKGSGSENGSSEHDSSEDGSNGDGSNDDRSNDDAGSVEDSSLTASSAPSATTTATNVSKRQAEISHDLRTSSRQSRKKMKQ